MTTSSDAFAWARARGIKTIRLGIYQPKTTGGMTEDVITLDELEAFAVLARSKACTVENAARDHGKVDEAEWTRVYLNPNPNEVECAFCRAMPTCPSAQRKVQDAIDADFKDLTAAENPISPLPPQTPADLSAAMAATGFIEDWIKAVRAEVERRLLAGETVEGFGLELGRQGPRKFADEEAAENLLRRQMRLKLEDAYDFKLKSPTQIEKLSKPTKDDGGAEVPPVIGPRQWKKVEALIVRSDAKPSVKPAATIKTPYVVPKPSGDDFAPVTESAAADEDDLF